MIKSMTGYGRGEHKGIERSFSVELRAVNHRYLETSVKLPRRFAFAEELLKKAVKERVSRGKLDVFLNYIPGTESESELKLDLGLARKYYERFCDIADAIPGLKDDMSVTSVAMMPDVLVQIPASDDQEKIGEEILDAARAALDSFDAMRAAEGAKLIEDILMRADIIEKTVLEIEEYAPSVEKQYYEKLAARLSEMLEGAEIPRERLLTEAAVFADKANITEEIVRLKSHVAQLRAMTADPKEPVGKKLDFLVQEMNREANTIGSKANDINITQHMLALKAEIEKIREQVQNIE